MFPDLSQWHTNLKMLVITNYDLYYDLFDIIL